MDVKMYLLHSMYQYDKFWNYLIDGILDEYFSINDIS